MTTTNIGPCLTEALKDKTWQRIKHSSIVQFILYASNVVKWHTFQRNAFGLVIIIIMPKDIQSALLPNIILQTM